MTRPVDSDNETVAIGEREFRLSSALPVKPRHTVEAAACCRSVFIPGSDVIATREHTNMGVSMFAWGPRIGTTWTIRSLLIEPGLSQRSFSEEYRRAFLGTHLRFRGAFCDLSEGALVFFDGRAFAVPILIRARETLSLLLSCPEVAPSSALFVRLFFKVTVGLAEDRA